MMAMTKPSDVPNLPLRDGGQLPLVGLGTWKLRGDSVATSVAAALAVGYRHIDTATMYDNEAAIGEALEASPIDRDDVFLTTKLRPSDAGRAEKVLRSSLRALRTDRVDLWLLHWPPAPPRAGKRGTSCGGCGTPAWSGQSG